MKAKEPPPGAIPTPATGEFVAPSDVPDGWVVHDNAMFRYSFALPEGWYANMRSEGGEFSVFDPSEMAFFESGEDRPGGVAMFLAGTSYQLGKVSPFSEQDAQRLASPNAQFGTYGGVIWDDPDAAGLGVARVIRFAFVRDNLIFSGRVNFGEGYSESDLMVVRQILGTITPY
jgi:hypothetical protein